MAALLVFIVFLVCIAGSVPIGVSMIVGSFAPIFSMGKGGSIEQLSNNTFSGANSTPILAVPLFILGGVIQLGYAKYLLKQHNRQEAGISDLFSEFERFGQGFAQKFLRNLYTFLWSLLFIIPGIIKGLSYAMTPYLMAENPELSAQDAIRLSIQLMEGHKGDLFWLHLTFIGWDLLAALTMNIGYLVLNPYRNAAEAAFYRQLTAADSTPEYI